MPVQALHTRQRLAPAPRALDVPLHVHKIYAPRRRRHYVIKATLNTTVKQLKSIIDPQTAKGQSSDFANANFPVDQEGRTLHLGCKRGEVANRILSVGSMDRALMIADQLQGAEPGAPLFQHLSGRGFLTITGLYQGTPVSIITTLMGMPNMDFVVREARAVVEGQMAVIRLGTCGALRPPAKLGSFMVASPGAVCVRRDPDAWTFDDGRPHYTVSAPVPADPQLVQLLVAACTEHGGADSVVQGLDATADSFYSSQGRTGGHFEDVNEAVIEQLMAAHPQLVSLEMETFHLLDLARCSRGGIKAAAFCIAAAERYSNRFISKEQIQLCVPFFPGS
ncbi:hypothetical protein OEZ85_012832 [Tetradesmus obliquus]|uniref:Nucleoside phosphorylase domain-containing protein n=1 Tax=Tetradesmus obliquus TaxID=3088 RepID=A0ABY8U8Z8_TETOB|nr:hypothetical protein OEZ85_012832 [Tetradesmus obliquus]